MRSSGITTATKDYQDLIIPRTCEYVPLLGKRNFTHGIKSEYIKSDVMLHYLDGCNIITKVIKSGRGKKRKEFVMKEDKEAL